MEGIYKFYYNCGRMGSLEGIFTATSEEIKELIGQYVYFGEVLGKHSEIDGNIEADDITLVTNDPEAVRIFNKYDLSSGFNPLDAVE